MRYEDVDWTQASCHGVWTEMFFIENTAEAALHDSRFAEAVS
jgi:GH25 family lysozyme M1 (1,4-beta-N-acetylmuramidase)